ncbi:hypothetical protein NHJ13051_009772 [Beauveria bassiana]
MSTSRSPEFGVIIDSATRRFACDQCHNQKLRYAADAPDDATRISPQSGNPRVVLAEYATVDPPSASIITSFSEFFGIPSPSSLQSDTQSHAFASPGHHPGGIGIEQPPTPLAPKSIAENHFHDTAHKLSELNTALLRLNNSLHGEPWASMFESPTTLADLLTSCDQQANKIVYEYPLVEVFEKTQAFTNLAKAMIPTFTLRQSQVA